MDLGKVAQESNHQLKEIIRTTGPFSTLQLS